MTGLECVQKICLAAIFAVFLWNLLITHTDLPNGHSIRSEDSSIDLSASELKCCLGKVKKNMPIDSSGKIRVHHSEANTGRWNEEMRWVPIQLEAPCNIWYIGANTHGRDGIRLQREYSCEIQVFEPVPSFFEQLQLNWENVPRKTLHNYGLGSSTRVVKGVQEQGESTFAMKGSEINNSGKNLTSQLFIKSVYHVWNELGSPQIDLLHVNCEGCEWELLESLLMTNITRKIQVIQYGTHWFPDIVDIERRYCEIESRLDKTHKNIYGQPFGWDRWDILERIIR